MSKIKLVCPQCGGLNQAPAERLAEGPVCGKCQSALLPGKPVAVDGAGLQRFIQHSELPLLVDFWAPWCGPCVSFAPTFERFADTVSDQMLCLKLDTEAHQQAAGQYAIRSIPTLALFGGGREIDRVSGAMPPAQLAQWVLQKLGQ
ncbi:MAG: thioredoxin TrxC [Wenzhouxiangellaceae bacterium]